ncbi:MAG: lipopolysaccharide transport periplasmic protein LptA [Pseudomonadota bacterium]
MKYLKRSRLLTLLLVGSTPCAMAQTVDLDLRLPWDIVSETMAFDGKTSTIIYTGLRFSQGRISIEANEGRATSAAQENSSWQFSGDVVIDVDQGKIRCDAASLQFDGNVLSVATVTGAPATFEMRRADSDDTTYAEAGKLLYDVPKGIIEFSDDATITEAGNQISSHYLVYNINERRINADSSGNGGERVRITYTPDELPPADADDDAPN